jgi:hypothetical protein
MMYPSLLYRAAPTGVRLSPGVFSDLQLTKILSADTLDTLSVLCAPEDITLRQAVYRDTEANLSAYETLTLASKRLNGVHSAYSSARSVPERDYLFARLILAALDFAGLASAIPGDSELIADFRAGFSGSFSAERSDSEGLSALTDSILDLEFSVKGDNLKVSCSAGSISLAKRLQFAADSLGLNIRFDKREADTELNTRIINAVSALFPEEFKRFSDFHKKFESDFSTDLLKYCHELTLYTEIASLYAKNNITHNFPNFVSDKRLEAAGLLDLSLLFKEQREIAANDAFFTPQEPFFFLSGANGGGKTTYLRSIGTAAVLARSGLPVPAESMRVYPFSNILTHFPRDEHGESRLEDEQRRMAEILSLHGGDSLVLLNETFATTTTEKAAELTTGLSAALAGSGCLTLYITHQLPENNSLPVLTVAVNDANSKRTYKVVRSSGKTSSYAEDILRKYGF